MCCGEATKEASRMGQGRRTRKECLNRGQQHEASKRPLSLVNQHRRHLGVLREKETVRKNLADHGKT